MQYVLTPYERRRPPFAWWRNAFNEQELNWIQNKTKNANETAQVGSKLTGEQLSKVRRCKVDWMDNNETTRWVFDRLANVVSSLNADFFGFDLSGFGEPIQLTNYDSSDEGMYGWHQDYQATVSRKLSLVLQLSYPSDYEGGELQFMMEGKPTPVEKERGLIVLFPSFALHQVTPVTKGSRQTLVSWISGPEFK